MAQRKHLHPNQEEWGTGRKDQPKTKPQQSKNHCNSLSIAFGPSGDIVWSSAGLGVVLSWASSIQCFHLFSAEVPCSWHLLCLHCNLGLTFRVIGKGPWGLQRIPPCCIYRACSHQLSFQILSTRLHDPMSPAFYVPTNPEAWGRCSAHLTTDVDTSTWASTTVA